MMTDSGIIGIVLIVATVVLSYRGFTKPSFFEANKFTIEGILVRKEYRRLILSGFLHVSWPHLIFNMISLYIFSGATESYLGGFRFAIIYFASLLGGDLLSLFVHRNHSDYSAVGASGAVCGVIFAAIALFPGMNIGFFLLPFSIPAWIYGLLFVLYSIYGVQSKKENIGHDAHLGGALIGMLTALLMQPDAFARNYTTILIIALPAIAFIVFILARPQTLLIDSHYYKAQHQNYNIDHKFNEAKSNRQREVDRILDKINKKGINSLTREEQQLLEEYSRSVE